MLYLIITAECERCDVLLIILKSQDEAERFQDNKNTLPEVKINSGILGQGDYHEM